MHAAFHFILTESLTETLNDLIVTELEDFVTYWKNHCIRKNSGIEAPSGIPTDMFDMPEEFGTNHCTFCIIQCMALFLIMYPGGEDCLCSCLDDNIWLYIML